MREPKGVGAALTTRRRVTLIFFVAVALNYLWELGQSPLYAGMDRFGLALWHCFVASSGDGLLVLLIFAAGRLAFGKGDWYERPGAGGRLLTLAAGVLIGVGVEWAALRFGYWEYGAAMPYVPLTRVGAAPVAQMLLLPPLVFYIAARWGRKMGE